MKIAVTGAFSYSGKYIAKRLLDSGEEVITLTGHPNRPDPFSGKVKAYPLDFDETNMVHSLQGVSVLVNTYWVRFNTNENTQQRAVENTRKLVNAAKAAGVTRIVHISIANPSSDSPQSAPRNRSTEHRHGRSNPAGVTGLFDQQLRSQAFG